MTDIIAHPVGSRPSRSWARCSRAALGMLLLRSVVGAMAADASEPVADILEQASAAEARFDPQAALALYEQALTGHPDDAAILQKISRQYSDLADDAPDVAEQKRLCTEALDYSQRAVALQPDRALNLVSLAICYGKLGALSDTRTRVKDSRLVKELADRALALDPDSDYAHHVLGRWNYEVASLNAASRLVVRVVYGGLPPASTAEAVRQLQRAAELAPDVPGHRLELGFALLADGQRDAARTAWQEGLAMAQREKYEDGLRQHAREKLAKLGGD